MSESEDASAAQRALQIAFQTMQERCQQLQKRLLIVEDENMGLRIRQSIENPEKVLRGVDSSEMSVENLQKKVEELSKQKAQLTHHVFMVAAENRQLWNRLTRLTRSNKNLGNQLLKITDTLKQHPSSQPLDTLIHSFEEIEEGIGKKNLSAQETIELGETGNKEASLEEISLRLINSIMMEKSELEQQCNEMVEMQNGADINLQNIGFTYPEEMITDSLQQLTKHDQRLLQTKETLASQQMRLKRVLRSLKKMKRGTACKNCRQNASKTTCQIGTQIDSDDSLREGATQTSLPPSTSPVPQNPAAENLSPPETRPNPTENVCPLCGTFFGKSTPFESFHEHVVGHFTKENALESFEIVH